MSKKLTEIAPIMFMDGQGRKWHPRIDCNVLRLFERELDCGPFQALEEIVNKGKIGKCLTLAFLACAEEVKELEIDIDDFCAAFENDEQTKALVEGISEAVQLFFQSRKKKGSEPAAQNPSPSENVV